MSDSVFLDGHTEPLCDWADDMSVEMREALERSIAQADAGNVISYEKAMAIIDARFSKR